MAIIAKATGGGGNFVPCPAGAYPAVCCDVVDLGELKVSYGGKEKTQHKIRICWQVDENMPDGKPFMVSKRYTLSLHEKATLTKDLESWRGKQFTETELGGFDVETVIGVPCYLNVVQTKKGEDIYANVTAVMRLPRGTKPLETRDYQRVKDRPKDGGSPSAEQQGQSDEPPWDDHISDDDVPF